MASLKRRIAKVQVTLRRRQQAKEEKQLLKLQTERNKSLKDAGKALAIAQAKEDAKDAALKKSQAKARLNKAKSQKGKKLLKSLASTGSKLLKDLRQKSEKKAVKRKPAKKTVKKTVKKATRGKKKS